MVAVYVCGGGGDGHNKTHLDVSDWATLRNMSAVVSEEEGVYVLELLAHCDGHMLHNLSLAEAKQLAADIDSGQIPESSLEWDQYGEDGIRSWHAAVVIHRVRKDETKIKSPSARSFRVIAYPNSKARMQAQMVTPDTCASQGLGPL